MSKNTAVFGIYSSGIAVEEAADTLRLEGFRGADISVLFPDNTGSKDFAHERNTKAPEGSTTGVVAGGIAGGVLGWLTGIGALAIPDRHDTLIADVLAHEVAFWDMALS